MTNASSEKHLGNNQVETAIAILVGEIVDHVDQITAMRKRGHAALVSQAVFADMCQVLQKLEPELLDSYYSRAIQSFTDSEKPLEAGLTTRASSGSVRHRRPSMTERAMATLKQAVGL